MTSFRLLKQYRDTGSLELSFGKGNGPLFREDIPVVIFLGPRGGSLESDCLNLSKRFMNQ